jgi:predicted hydrocarbon binding protein
MGRQSWGTQAQNKNSKEHCVTETFDFDLAWMEKFRTHLDKTVGEEIREVVIQGGENLSAESSRLEVIEWTQQAMERLDSLVDERTNCSVLSACTCHYPKANLQEIKAVYATSKDIDRVHGMLQEQFEAFLKDTMQVSEEMFAEIISRGWGSAGIKRGNTIVATKIPKSGHLIEYMDEADPEMRRQYYCHCPRVREAVKDNLMISTTYCYCGAGFYKGIWEEILQRPVEVEVLESVLSGGDVCKIAIHLPDDA